MMPALHTDCSVVPQLSCRATGGSAWLGGSTFPSQFWQHCSSILVKFQYISHLSPFRPTQGRNVQFRTIQPPQVSSSWPSLYPVPSISKHTPSEQSSSNASKSSLS